MAPSPLCLVWREQIMDNLRLISGRSASIDIYSSRNPTNKSYTIYAVKVHKGKRQEILSAAGRDVEAAYESLHAKSAQEVYQFVELNGFAFPRGVKSEYDSDSTSDSDASTMDASEVVSISAVSSDSEEDDAAPSRGKKTKHNRKGKKKSSKRSKHLSSDEDSSSSEEEAPPRRRRPAAPAGRPSYIPAPPITTSQAPPPPPGWRGPPRVYPRPGAGVPPPLPPTRFPASIRPPPGMAAPAPLPGTVVSAPAPPLPPAQPSKPVRLVIRWAGHGERKVVESCQPSHRALQRAVLAHVRGNWQSFENVVAHEMTPGRLWGLGAKVRRVAYGGDMYAISAVTGGDDLGMYFKADEIPKFEVEVDHDGSVVPAPPLPPQPVQHHTLQ
ncbi:hypothetical protein CSOJ01_10852 [Colletotrichum sojae]|uniref:Uncharacterized protein n=1 Tax=Colletotrichum sojae TaxID=2175907 RepID=A0A8H6MPH2_9PEZI|nr:hypothetical protein CSOJ01_10852 [Colletotrichum sojae]